MKINMHRAKDTGEKSCETDAERIVQKYLDSFLEQHDDSINDSMEQTFNRVVCCETSSSLYCNKCCNLLVPDGSLPEPISLRRSTTQQHDKESNDNLSPTLIECQDIIQQGLDLDPQNESLLKLQTEVQLIKQYGRNDAHLKMLRAGWVG